MSRSLRFSLEVKGNKLIYLRIALSCRKVKQRSAEIGFARVILRIIPRFAIKKLAGRESDLFLIVCKKKKKEVEKEQKIARSPKSRPTEVSRVVARELNFPTNPHNRSERNKVAPFCIAPEKNRL